MVNVNTEVSSSMELPYGEYTQRHTRFGLGTGAGAFVKGSRCLPAAFRSSVLGGRVDTLVSGGFFWLEGKLQLVLVRACSSGCSSGGVAEP